MIAKIDILTGTIWKSNVITSSYLKQPSRTPEWIPKNVVYHHIRPPLQVMEKYFI